MDTSLGLASVYICKEQSVIVIGVHYCAANVGGEREEAYEKNIERSLFFIAWIIKFSFPTKAHEAIKKAG